MAGTPFDDLATGFDGTGTPFDGASVSQGLLTFLPFTRRSPDPPPDQGYPSRWAAPWAGIQAPAPPTNQTPAAFLPFTRRPPDPLPDRGYSAAWRSPWVQPQAPRPGQLPDFFRPPPPPPLPPPDQGYPAVFRAAWMPPQKPAPPVVPVPLLITWDRAAPPRTRQHERVVAEILNSLIRNFGLVRVEQEIWKLGYAPGDESTWGPGVLPGTVGEAIDRLAALVAALNGGTGP